MQSICNEDNVLVERDAKMSEDKISVDWCEDTVTRQLPWDEDQFVSVRRFTGREKRRRQALAGTFRLGPEKSDDVEIQMTYDKLKDFEWATCITNFRLLVHKGGKDLVMLFSSKDNNQEVYDHITGRLEEFIDNLILEVNKEESTEVPTEDVKDIEGNSNGSLDKSSKTKVQ